jgi:hypothetical protein
VGEVRRRKGGGEGGGGRCHAEKIFEIDASCNSLVVVIQVKTVTFNIFFFIIIMQTFINSLRTKSMNETYKFYLLILHI